MELIKPQKQHKTVSIRRLSLCVGLTGLLFLTGLLILTHRMTQEYETFVENTNDYILLEQQVHEVREASDYLTEQVRLFVRNGDLQYVERYLEEVNVTRRRDAVLEHLSNHFYTEDWNTQVRKAVQLSMDLTVQEYYAMQLAATAWAYDPATLPEEIQAVTLKAEDAALEPDAMLEKARDMLYNAQYGLTKEEIYEDINVFAQGILLEIEAQSQDGRNVLEGYADLLRILMILAALFLGMYVTCIATLVVKPLQNGAEAISMGKPMKEATAQEIDSLANAYNRVR